MERSRGGGMFEWVPGAGGKSSDGLPEPLAKDSSRADDFSRAKSIARIVECIIDTNQKALLRMGRKNPRVGARGYRRRSQPEKNMLESFDATTLVQVYLFPTRRRPIISHPLQTTDDHDNDEPQNSILVDWGYILTSIYKYKVLVVLFVSNPQSYRVKAHNT
jgi:hypothetical protein